MKRYSLLLFLTICLKSFAQLPSTFDAAQQPAAPDYNQSQHWIALPFREDAADKIPKREIWVHDSLKNVDVFYIYPTLYSKGKTWCADIENKRLNKRLQNLPVKFQATPFNQMARVYAPYYRQANIKAFYEYTGTGEKALDFAYQDVKTAFEFYMKNYNQGRPIIIVSHSQGTRHARVLLKEFFDTPEMKAKLVCAYVVGFGIFPEKYTLLSPCENAEEANCYVTWSSFKEGYTPDAKSQLVGQVCVNPISWKRDTLSTLGKGGILLSLSIKKPYSSTVRLKNNYLWVKTTPIFIKNRNVMHVLDFNLFWFDIRKNVAQRIESYRSKFGK